MKCTPSILTTMTFALVLIIFGSAFPANPGFAQSAVNSVLESGKGGAAEPVLPKDLTKKAIRDVMSGLSDAQARSLLLSELDKQATLRAKQLAATKKTSIVDTVSGWGKAFVDNWVFNFRATPKIMPAIANSYSSFKSQRNDKSLWRVPGTLLASLFGALLVTLLFRRLTKARRAGFFGSKPESFWARMTIICGRFVLHSISLLVFVLSAYGLDGWLNRSDPIDSSVVKYVIGATGWTVFAIITARFMLSPTRPDLRLCSVDDDAARFLTWRTGLVFGFSAFFVGILTWLQQFDWSLGEARLGSWISLTFYGLVALTFWQGRKGITQMVLGEEKNSPRVKIFAELWPIIAIGLVFLQWLVVELIVATDNLHTLSSTAMKFSLVILVSVPLFKLVIKGLVKAIWPVDLTQELAFQAAHGQTQAGLVRCGHIILGGTLIVVLATLWGVDLRDLASQGMNAQIAGVLTEVFLIAIVAYGLWELINIVADRQIAMEKALAGDEDDDGGHGDGPGGKGGTRLGTLMPLIRGTGRVVIVVMAVLAILGQFGVNVTPLLAGAGIVGLAIGFGAQTLVKDIFSGIFFLIDDAFRKGEYLDLGSVKGTVEKISIRSMQLRHHNGPLHTVPFGSINQLTNFSRDWAIMKLTLRLTYDTDGNKVRKMIKNLGQELLQHPEIGPLFLEPLKSQGIRAMEDSAMIMRIKFTTKPGDQFTIRRFVLDEIQKMFDANGIKFATRQVTVHVAGEDENAPNSQNVAAAGAAAASAMLAEEDAPGGVAKGV